MGMNKVGVPVHVGLPDWAGNRKLNIDAGGLKLEFEFNAEQMEAIARGTFNALAAERQGALLNEFSQRRSPPAGGDQGNGGDQGGDDGQGEPGSMPSVAHNLKPGQAAPNKPAGKAVPNAKP